MEGEVMKIDNEVLNVLSNAETDGTLLRLIGQLDRNLYTRTNKVIEAAGGKWDRKAKGHVFEIDASDAMDQIILTGEISSVKTKAQQFGFFPTPANVAARVIELAQIELGMRVLEPSAGKGALAYPAAEAGGIVDCYELMDTNYAALAGDPKLGSVRHMDFLAQVPEPSYDRVVMNPPFDKQADIKHVQHGLKFLKSGGLLVSVMASGVTFRDNKLTTEFRDLIRQRGGDIEALPEGSFKESGTMVNTVIVTIPS
jgi:predicted RNA methylase